MGLNEGLGIAGAVFKRRKGNDNKKVLERKKVNKYDNPIHTYEGWFLFGFIPLFIIRHG